MAQQPIPDEQVAPGAIVSSSLATRYRDNTRDNNELLTLRTAGDVVVGFYSAYLPDLSALSTKVFNFTLEAYTPYAGTLRFTIPTGGAEVSRNGVSLGSFLAGDNDISGWSAGDKISVLQSKTHDGVTEISVSYTIKGNRPGSIPGSIVVAETTPPAP